MNNAKLHHVKPDNTRGNADGDTASFYIIGRGEEGYSSMFCLSLRVMVVASIPR